MTADKSKMTLWTRYFDSKLSRSEGRRVPKEASIPNPSLDSVVWAARDLGLSKMKRDLEASHPSRPHLKEDDLFYQLKKRFLYLMQTLKKSYAEYWTSFTPSVY